MLADRPCSRCHVTTAVTDLVDGQCRRCRSDTGVREAGAGPQPRDASSAEHEQVAAQFPELDIERCIGRGGMGVVWRVRQRHLDRRAAMKLLSPELAHEPSFGARFEREARALARLDHAGIVRVYDFGVSRDQPWLLMEMVEGANLRTMMREGTIEPARAMALASQACRALECAHAAGIVHRDIKPENMLVDHQGRLKLVDFGLAKLGQQSDADPRLTMSAQGLGTFRYVAPEQMTSAADVDARADIYSLGVVLYELLTGELPIGRFDAPSKRRRGVDERFDEVVLRALEQDREQRHRDAAAMRAAIDRALGTAPSASLAQAIFGPGSITVRLAFVGLGIGLLIVSLLHWSVFVPAGTTPAPAWSMTLWQREYRPQLPNRTYHVAGYIPALAAIAAVLLSGLRATHHWVGRVAMWVTTLGAAAVLIESFTPDWELSKSDTTIPPLAWFALCCAVPILETLDRRALAQASLAERLSAPRLRLLLPAAPIVFALLAAAISRLEG